MKARILPLEEVAEYGKTDTVVLTISINSTEAGIVLDYMERENGGELPTAVRLLTGYLETIRERADCQYRQDVVNTEARLTRYIGIKPTDADRSALRTLPEPSEYFKARGA
jgi:hypothetical protein